MPADSTDARCAAADVDANGSPMTGREAAGSWKMNALRNKNGWRF
jgi:hypothetical protein